MFEVSKSFCEISLQFAKKYSGFVILNADSSKEFDLARFQMFFPDRVFNFGMGQRDMLGAASGFSVGGKVPFVTGLAASLIEKGFDQIKNSICKSNLNIKICGIVDDFEGDDIAVMRGIPNMKVLIPADVYELKSMMEAMMENYGPTYLRLERMLSDKVYSSVPDFKFGEVDVLSTGGDVVIFAVGNMVGLALEVEKILRNEGISIAVVNMSSIKPVNEEKIVNLLKGAKCAVTIEQHSKKGGLYGVISEVAAERWPVTIKGIGYGDDFFDGGDVDSWNERWGLRTEDVAEKVRMMIKVWR
jgi:transketolase